MHIQFLVLLVHKALKVRKAHKVLLELAHKVLLERRAQKVHKAFKVRKAHKVLLELAHKVLRVHKVLRDQLVLAQT
jgi:hypothetical protein